jgi:ribosomal protein L29
MTKFKDLKSKKPAELKKLIEERDAAMREFRFGLSGGKVKNVKSSRDMRKDVARALTIINNQSKVEAPTK